MFRVRILQGGVQEYSFPYRSVRRYEEVPDRMRQVSDHAHSLLVRLNARPSPLSRLSGQSDSRAAILEELGRCAEPGVIPYLAPIVVWGNPHEVLAGARAVSALLQQTGAEDLIWLDEWMRGSWAFGSQYQEEWRSLTPRELARWVGPGEPGIALLKLSSFHGNGFVREEAVRRLSLIEDGSELPYLLLRLNDWVGQVRQAAHSAVAARITPSYISHFVANLALVVRLARGQRADLSGLLDQIDLLLARADAVPALVQGMRSRSKEVRRAAFRHLISSDGYDLERRLRIALTVEDPIIRLRAAMAAVERLGATQLPALLDMLSNDPAAPVRLEALVAWVNRFPEQAGERLMGALLDRSAAVRAQARYYIRHRDGLDFALFYQSELTAAQPGRLVIALSGLVETGGRAKADQIAPFLTHPSAQVRRTAIRGVMSLSGDQYTGPVLDRVFDQSTSVSRQAALFLQPHAGSIGATTLWALFEVAPAAHVKRQLLLLLSRLPKWESITYLVRAVAVGDHATAARARQFIRRWQARYNQGQAVPSREQLAQLEAALSKAKTHLDEETLALLWFTVRMYADK